MNTRDPRNEDGGYGAGNLVGSDESGLRSAIESREAVDAAHREHARAQDDAGKRDAGLGRLAGADAPGGVRAGTPAMDDIAQGTSAASAPRDARDDADRLDD